MKFYLAFILAAFTALPASAQWYAYGEFSTPDWIQSAPFADLGGGHYSGTVTADAAGGIYEYKVANGDFSQFAPPNNGRVTSNSSAEITFHLYENVNWNDGYLPNFQRRVGYDDPLQHGWEVMGSFDGWSTGLLMASQTAGVYTAQAPLNAGIHEFKFRKEGDWSINYGYDFSHNPGSNNVFQVWTDGDVWNFELDLPGGRWRAYSSSPQPDRNGDEHVTAEDYVLYRATDGSAAGQNAYNANYGHVPWLVRGSFNNFDYSTPMIDAGNGHYTRTISGLTPGNDYEYKLATYNFGQAYPGSNGKVRADANGEIDFHLWEQPAGGWTDGWLPNNVNRVGYDDHQQFDWELVGSFNGWPNTADPTYFLNDMTNGLHSNTFTFATPGTYDFKFRQQGSFDTTIGDNFGNAAANNSFNVVNAGDMWTFELDLPNGRWRAVQVVPGLGSGGAVPEPSCLMLALIGAMVGMGASRRRP
jgi:hypothetical protein